MKNVAIALGKTQPTKKKAPVIDRTILRTVNHFNSPIRFCVHAYPLVGLTTLCTLVDQTFSSLNLGLYKFMV